MKKIFIAMGLLTTTLLFVNCAMAGSIQLQYKLSPGQKWIDTCIEQSENIFGGKKNVSKRKIITEYKIIQGPKKGWVSLVARIKSFTTEEEGTVKTYPNMTLMEFRADMHSSGEIRNIHYKLDPSMPKGGENLAEGWINGVFWFPELPEYALKPGDEFDVKEKYNIGGKDSIYQIESTAKNVFILEDARNDLAFFSIKTRAVMKEKGAGGPPGVKSLSKGEAIFDLKDGMWVEFTTKTRHTMGVDQSAIELFDTAKHKLEKQ